LLGLALEHEPFASASAARPNTRVADAGTGIRQGRGLDDNAAATTDRTRDTVVQLGVVRLSSEEFVEPAHAATPSSFGHCQRSRRSGSRADGPHTPPGAEAGIETNFATAFCRL